MRIAINGFGRIGESIFKILLERKMNVVAINAVHGVKDAAYTVKYDSVYGKFNGKVSTSGNDLIVNGKRVKVISERDIEKLPWKKLKKSCRLISVASCTTNAAAIVAKVLNDNFGIKWAMLSTVHGYTSSQALVDSSDEKDPRRGRAAALNIVPTTTGASEAIIQAIPELKGKISGSALRAPVADGSIIDLVAELKKSFTIKKVNEAFKKASKKEMRGILEYSNDYLVSSDVIGNPNSAVFDSKLTQANGNLVKVMAWYDNEYGYSNRVVDVIKLLEKY